MVKKSSKSLSSISSFSLDDNSISTYGGRRRYDSRDLVSKDSKDGGFNWMDIVSFVLNILSLLLTLWLAYTTYNASKKDNKDAKTA